MAAASEITLLLLCCFISSAAPQANCDRYAAKGDTAMVPLQHHLMDSDKLRWTHGRSIKVDRRPTTEPVRFKAGSENDIYPNGSLKLMNVSDSNKGIYTPEVFKESGALVPGLKSVHLCVLDPVSEPQVKTECVQTKVVFSCQVAQRTKGINFEWLQSNKPLNGKTSQNMTLEAKNLGPDLFTCRVFNLASSRTSQTEENPCYNRGIVLPEKILGLSIWIFVGGGGGVVLVLIIIVIVCCIRTKRKNRFRIKDEEELRLRWSGPEQQRQQQQQQQQRQCHPGTHPPSHPCHQPQRHHQQSRQQAGCGGPHQHRTKQQHKNQHPRANSLIPPPSSHPPSSPRRPAQVPRPGMNGLEEQPPPLPQPRKKAARTPRM